MTEDSRPWQDGVGDGGPYNAATEWAQVLETLGLGVGANVGVIRNILNELAVTSTGDNNITVDTGRALLQGILYENDASESKTTASPTTGTTGRRAVLRNDYSARTTRIAIISNSDGTAALPALTQVAGVTWEIPLRGFTITTGGVIVLGVDEREYTAVPVASGRSLTKFSAARWLLPGWMFAAETTGKSPAADVIEFVPFLLQRSITIDRMGIGVTTLAAGEVARIGIYTATLGSDGLAPGTLILDAGTVSVASTGDKEATVSKTLGPGWYFTARVDESTTPRYNGIDDAQAVSLPVTGDENAFAPTQNVALKTDANAGADWSNNGLPSSAPAITGRVTLDQLATVMLREAA